jgi:hypothetical protein
VTHASLIAIASDVRAEMVDFATESRISLCPDDLDMACTLASWVLWTVLRRLGAGAAFVSGRAFGTGHCWVEVGDEIFDITATQFGDYADVLVCRQGAVYRPEYYGYPTGEEFFWDPEDPDFMPALEAIVERVVGEMERRAA